MYMRVGGNEGRLWKREYDLFIYFCCCCWNEGRREQWLVATAKCNSSQSPTDRWRPAWFGALSSSLMLGLNWLGATRQQLSWWCAGILGKRAKGYQVHGARRRQHHHRHVRVTCPGSPAMPVYWPSNQQLILTRHKRKVFVFSLASILGFQPNKLGSKRKVQHFHHKQRRRRRRRLVCFCCCFNPRRKR